MSKDIQFDSQPGILAPIPQAGRFLSFSLHGSASQAGAALQTVREACDPDYLVLGIGQSLALALGHEIPGLRPFPTHVVAGFELPSTPAALWCWLSGADPGEVLHAARKLEALLTPAFSLTHSVDAFKHGCGRDLTGYEDGTRHSRNGKDLNRFRGGCSPPDRQGPEPFLDDGTTGRTFRDASRPSACRGT